MSPPSRITLDPPGTGICLPLGAWCHRAFATFGRRADPGRRLTFRLLFPADILGRSFCESVSGYSGFAVSLCYGRFHVITLSVSVNP
jgi:hypothetical protein